MIWHRSHRVHIAAHAVAPGPGVTICSVMAPLSPSQRWPPGAAPLTTPSGGCAPSRARWPDPYCSLGFRLAQQSGAWSAAAPSTSSKARPWFPVVIHSYSWPFHMAFPPAIHRPLSRCASRNRRTAHGLLHLGRNSLPESERGLDAARSCPHNPARPRFPTRTTPCRRPSHILERSCAGPLSGLGHADGGSNEVKRGPHGRASCLQCWAPVVLPPPSCPKTRIQIWDMTSKQVGVGFNSRGPIAAQVLKPCQVLICGQRRQAAACCQKSYGLRLQGQEARWSRDVP